MMKEVEARAEFVYNIIKDNFKSVFNMEKSTYFLRGVNGSSEGINMIEFSNEDRSTGYVILTGAEVSKDCIGRRNDVEEDYWLEGLYVKEDFARLEEKLAGFYWEAKK